MAKAASAVSTVLTDLPAAKRIRELEKEVARLRIERDILNSDGLLREGAAVKFAFVRNNRAAFDVGVMCSVLGVTPADFYAWLGRPECPRRSRLAPYKLGLATPSRVLDKTRHHHPSRL